MSLNIRLKHSATKDKKPVVADLKPGELALNVNNASLAGYALDDANVVQRMFGKATETQEGQAEIATQAEVTTGTDDEKIVTPLKLATAVPAATESLAGKAELATQAEVTTGTDDEKIVTPLKLATAVPAATEALAGKAEIATQAEVTAGTDDTRIVTPLKLATSVPAASDTVAGKAELATQAEVAAGTDTTRIVTPATAKATFVDLAGDTMTGQLTLPGGGTGNDAITIDEVTAAIGAIPSEPGTKTDAWGTITDNGVILSSFNTASVTKEVTTGEYSVKFTTPMPASDYSVVIGGGAIASTATNKTVNGFTVKTWGLSGVSLNPVFAAFDFQVNATK